MPRLPRSPTHTAPLAAAALALAGCNAVFGLGEVTERTSTGTTGGGGSGGTMNTGATGSGGSAGGTAGSGGVGPICPDPVIAGDLVTNGSFETDGGWSAPTPGHGTLDYVPAESCDLACGDRVARLSGEAADGEYVTLGFNQTVQHRIDLGGTLRLSARYRFESSFAPYFNLVANGYDVGAPALKGIPQGDQLVIDDLAIPVEDPRRTEDHFDLTWTHSILGGKAVSWLDCVSVVYDPPPGAELLSNGWFDSLLQGWEPLGSATVSTSGLVGQCSGAAAVVTFPGGEQGDALATTKVGSWAEGTTFRFGGAAGALQFDDPPIPPFSLVLRLDYMDDGDPGTLEYEEKSSPSSVTSQTWEMAMGELAAARPVTAITLRLVVDNTGSPNPETFAADCFTVRGIP